MKFFINSTLFCIAILMFSCSKQPTPEELFNERSSGVVMIMNKYYYKIVLPTGDVSYFKEMSPDGKLENLCSDMDEIEYNYSFATGFFIDDSGTIMTNRHVVEPRIDEYAVKSSYIETAKELREFLISSMADMRRKYNELEDEKKECYYYDYVLERIREDESRKRFIEQQQEDLVSDYTRASDMADVIMSYNDPSAYEVEVVCEVGISYNNTYISDESDFLKDNSCVVKKVSDKEDVDLALIQLKNKKTPKSRYVFDIRNEGARHRNVGVELFDNLFNKRRSRELTIDSPLYMIGYNAGPTLGITKEGLNAQLTSGKLTQLPDGKRLLYSIPTLQGSSGSPLLDEEGQFVGVNFAKLKGTDSFNFGIPQKAVVKFME